MLTDCWLAELVWRSRVATSEVSFLHEEPDQLCCRRWSSHDVQADQDNALWGALQRPMQAAKLLKDVLFTLVHVNIPFWWLLLGGQCRILRAENRTGHQLAANTTERSHLSQGTLSSLQWYPHLSSSTHNSEICEWIVNVHGNLWKS